jgi:hypothetical protein
VINTDAPRQVAVRQKGSSSRGQQVIQQTSLALLGIGLLLIFSGNLSLERQMPESLPLPATVASSVWNDGVIQMPAPALYIPLPPYVPPPVPTTPGGLRIPAIGLNSPVMAVGEVRGEIGTPCDPNYPLVPCDTNKVAWYDQSPLPGDAGDAILDSHELWYGAHPPLYVPAAFTHLYEVKVGDQVIVTDAKGQVWTFMVDQISTLAWPTVPTNMYSWDGTPSVMLVTCSGVYNPSIHGLQNRVYVHATWTQEGMPTTLDAPRPLIPFKQPWA